MSDANQSLAGRTIRWTFDDGPTAGTTYEHTFSPDGTVTWRDVSAKKAPAKPAEAKSGDGNSGNGRSADGNSKDGKDPEGVPYASFEVAPDVHLVSYLSDSGYTLTVTVNLGTLQCSGVASNEEEWYPSTGRVEVVH